MSLNQIIDQSPASALSALVVDKTLNLKAEQIKVKTNVIANTVFAGRIALDPSSSYIYEMPITIKLWDGADQNVVFNGVAPTIARFRRVGDVTSVGIANFTINSASVAAGKIRIIFGTVLPERFRPFGGLYCAPLRGKDNNVFTTSPLAIKYDVTGNLYFEIASNYADGDFTTAVTPGTIQIGPTDSYINLTYTSI